MTVTSSVTLATGVGDGSTDEFSFSPIVVYDAADIHVILRDSNGNDTDLTQGNNADNYTVTLNSTQFLPSTGYITYPNSGTKLQTGEFLYIRRVVDITQDTDLENQGGYFPEVQEQALDKLTMIALQQQEQIDRSLKTAVSSSLSTVTFPEPDPTKLLGWDTDGHLANVESGITIDDTSLVVTSDIEPPDERGRWWFDESGGAVLDIGVGFGDPYGYQSLFTVVANASIRPNLPFRPEQILINGDNAGYLLAVQHSDEGTTPLTAYFIKNQLGQGSNDGQLLSQFIFEGPREDAAQDQFAKLTVSVTDSDATNRSGDVAIYTTDDGTPTVQAVFGKGLQVGSASGSPGGEGYVNAKGYLVDGVALTATAIEEVSGTTQTIDANDHNKTIYYTNAAGCTITLPDIATVFDGFSVKLVNLCGGVSSTVVGGTQCVINTQGSDVFDPDITTFNLWALTGYHIVTVVVMNGMWHTLEKKWEITGNQYTTGSGYTVTVSLPGTSTVMATDVHVSFLCTSDDGGYTANTHRIQASPGARSTSGADTLGFSINSSTGGQTKFVHTSAGYRDIRLDTRVHFNLASTKWLAEYFVGY